jgi:hypothetical protein
MSSLLYSYLETKFTNFLKQGSPNQNVSMMYNLDVRKFYNSYFKYIHILWILKEIEGKVTSVTVQCDICNVSNLQMNGQGGSASLFM